MSLSHKSNHSLTLKRRRGRRNLKNAPDDDQLQPEDMEGIERTPSTSTSLSQRPSSSGAAYLGCAPGLQNQRLASEEPFSHFESDSSSREIPEFSRSMTENGIMITAVASSSSRIMSEQNILPDWWNEFLENTNHDPSNPFPEICNSPSTKPSTPIPTLYSPPSLSLSDNLPAVHRLPNELLTLIFEQGSCFASRRMLTPKYPLMPVQPANTVSFMLTVLHVCHRWREVAIHTPALWTSLLVSRPRSVELYEIDKDHSKHMEWVARSLKRSQNLPLDITIDCSNISPTPVIKQLIAESHRWRSLSIMVPCSQSLPAVLSPLKDVEVPMLESLEITANKVVIPNETYTPFFSSSPKLTQVHLNRVRLLWDANPLNNLTSLELRFIIWPDFIDLRQIFLRSPTLENLVLHFDNYAFSRLDRGGLVPIPIPCLRSLELRFFYDETPNVVRLIQLFNIPTLESLILKDLSCADWCRVLPYFRSYSASYPALRSLTLCNIKGLICVDSSTVRAFPHLTHLSLSGVYSNAFSRLLLHDRTDDGYNALVWPKLRSLRILNDTDTKVDLLQLAMVSRAAIGRPIRRLVLDQHLFESHPDIVEQLRYSMTVENASYVQD